MGEIAEGRRGQRRFVVGDRRAVTEQGDWIENQHDVEGVLFEEGDRQEANEAMLAIEAMGHYFGGTYKLSPIRRCDLDGRYFTAGWIVEWSPYAPALEQRAQPLAPVPDAEPEVPPAEQEAAVPAVVAMEGDDGERSEPPVPEPEPDEELAEEAQA